MAAPERQRGFARHWLVAATAALALAACASGGKSAGSKEPALPPQTVVAPPSEEKSTRPQPPAAEPQSDPASQGREPARKVGKDDPTLVRIDAATSSATAEPKSLAAAAAQERQRRQLEGQPALVINNKNLATYAAGGVLTIAQDDPTKPSSADSSAASKDGKDAATGETYWRQRGLEIRTRWRDAVERIPSLQAKAEVLRQRFYSTDDPAQRDGQVKPEWDRALADLEQARYQAARGAEEVATFLDEGRRAGALPGWLREGAELEPEPVLETTDGIQPLNEPQEPTVYSEPPADPPPTFPQR